MTKAEALKDSKNNFFQKIARFRDEYDDLPDGAFFAIAEEQDIDVDDWAWFAEVEESLI